MSNPENWTMAERLYNRKTDKDLDYRQLSDMTGISYDRVRAILPNPDKGPPPVDPRPDEIVSLADALTVSPLYVLTGRHEKAVYVCDETGLYNTSIDRLRYLKNRPDFPKIKEVIDLLLKYPAFLDTLHDYLVEELTDITFFDPDTKQLRTVNVMSGEPEPENPNFPRLKYLPSEYARLQILDWLTIIRRKEQAAGHDHRQEVQQDQRRNDPTGAARSKKTRSTK